MGNITFIFFWLLIWKRLVRIKVLRKNTWWNAAAHGFLFVICDLNQRSLVKLNIRSWNCHLYIFIFQLAFQIGSMNLFIRPNRLLKNPIENQRIFDVTNVEMVEICDYCEACETKELWPKIIHTKIRCSRNAIVDEFQNPDPLISALFFLSNSEKNMWFWF